MELLQVRLGGWGQRAWIAGRAHQWAIGVYLATRLFLLVLALVNGPAQHHTLSSEVANWDGQWYLRLATRGYPDRPIRYQTTLGFFPLYPLVLLAVGRALSLPLTLSGLLVAELGGLVAVLLVERLVASWWGEAAARRAVVLFCVFPGSVVFSMVYSEGLLIPLAAGCLLCLQQRRFVWAGVLAGFAGAVGPNGVTLVAVLAVAAFLELRRSGWRSRSSIQALAGLAISPAGVVAFAAYLWAHTGTPLASYNAQRYGWGEQTDPLALVHVAKLLFDELSASEVGRSTINLNLVVGLLGAVLLAVGLVLLLRRRWRVPATALTFVLAIGFLTVTSEHVPPNPRMLITAFPALLVLVAALGRRGYRRLVWVSGVLLGVMSAITYVGIALRP